MNQEEEKEEVIEGSVFLPDPSKPNFGMRASRWARDIPMKDDKGKADSNGVPPNMVCISEDPDELFDVTIGFWHSSQPRHMELDIRIHRAADDNADDEGKRDLLKDSVYVLDAYMGGDFSRFHWYHPKPNSLWAMYGTRVNGYLNEHFWNGERHSKKTRAPFAIAVDVKERWFGFDATHYFFDEKTHRMTGSTFRLLLKKFLRWGYTLGKAQLFKFQPFFFVNNHSQDLTNSDRTEENTLRFINCQASVSLCALWWMREFDELSKEPEHDATNTDLICDKLSPLLFPRIRMENYVSISPLEWKDVSKEESRKQMDEFLHGAAVKRALSDEFSEANVTKLLVLINNSAGTTAPTLQTIEGTEAGVIGDSSIQQNGQFVCRR